MPKLKSANVPLARILERTAASAILKGVQSAAIQKCILKKENVCLAPAAVGVTEQIFIQPAPVMVIGATIRAYINVRILISQFVLPAPLKVARPVNSIIILIHRLKNAKGVRWGTVFTVQIKHTAPSAMRLTFMTQRHTAAIILVHLKLQDVNIVQAQQFAHSVLADIFLIHLKGVRCAVWKIARYALKTNRVLFVLLATPDII